MGVQSARWIRHSVQIAIMAVCASGFAGCTTSPSRVDSRQVIPRATVATVLVRNHHGADLRIWVLFEDGTSHRLGIVPKLGSATMVLPQRVALPAQVSFVAIPMSADEPQTSSPVIVEIGAKLVFTVAHHASLSTLSRLP